MGHVFWGRLHFRQILIERGFSAEQATNAELSVLHRLISPGNELSIPSWLKTVAAADIIDNRAEASALDGNYLLKTDRLDMSAEEI